MYEGLGKFKVRRPKGSEGYPEVTVRESPNDLTLREEEVGTWKSYIDVDHTQKERWGPPLVDYDWYAFCQALCKGIEGEDWEEMYESYKEMSRAVGVKKSQEVQKAKAFWKMKAAKDRKEAFLRSGSQRQRFLRSTMRLEEHLKDPICCAGQSLEVDSQY